MAEIAPRCWSSAAGPAATSRRSAPASSASTSCWSSRAGARAGWAAPASMSAASRRRRSSMPPTPSISARRAGDVGAVRPARRAADPRLRAHDRMEGRHRRPSDQRRRRAAEAAQGQDRAGPRRDARRQDLPGRDRHRPADRRAEHVVLATGSEPASAAGAAVRRPRHLLDRGAVAAGGARAAGGGRRRLYRPRARHRLRQARRQGHGGRGRGPHPAALRRGADASGRPPPEGAGRRGADRRQGRRPVRRRASAAGRAGRAARRATSRPTRSSSPPDGGPDRRASASNGSTSR